ncbi:conjugative transposon protein TraN [Chryseobacterium paludis]|uniref:conjugative transposon protein TraN n=1 Tax=Chryseobacterium paludis TaxID=2956784 RepID=UPI0021C0D19D|nr:conjugative transposon protein TraN [Chryseobacterium paludis]
MKTIIDKWLSAVLILFFTCIIKAQETTETPSLYKTRLEPYKMEVTYDKTTHLLFPSPIRYVDLGSEHLIANKAQDIENVLRIKSAVRDFEEETNFSVITQDGKFYNFDVSYSSYPDILNYDLLKLQQTVEKKHSTHAQFEELGGERSSDTELIMKMLHKSPKQNIKHIKAKSSGIQLSLKSLYVHEGKFYFILLVKNLSNINYSIDFINFKITDKKKLKRTVIQDKLLVPLRTFLPDKTVRYQTKEQAVYLLNQFTLLKGQVLEIEVVEKDGSRHQKIHVKNTDLINASIIESLN